MNFPEANSIILNTRNILPETKNITIKLSNMKIDQRDAQQKQPNGVSSATEKTEGRNSRLVNQNNL